jgi:ABC-2 type transport system permease protein
MTAATLSSSSAPPTEARTVGLANIARSEWTKLRTVRSTYWTAIIAVLVTIGIAVIGTTSFMQHFRPGDLEGFDAPNFVLQGLYAAQLALGALGVMTITGEYATGMIRTTLSSVPQRRIVVSVKGLIYIAAIFVIGEVTSLATFAIGQGILHQKHAGVGLFDPNVLRVVIGGGLYVTAVGLLAFAIGTLVRRTAGALSAFFGVLFLPSALIDLLPRTWRADAIKFAPVNAGTQILNTHRIDGMLGPWQGLGFLVLYGAIILVGALWLLGRRDA